MRWPFTSATGGVGRPFVIVFPGRTGSSWLVSALDDHPAVEARGEILVRRDAREQADLIPGALAARGRIRARGFKTKIKDVADPDLLRTAIHAAEAVVVHMRRPDRLRLALSRINARRLHAETGRWNRTESASHAARGGPIAFDEWHAALVACGEEVDRVDAFAASMAGEVVEVRYAEILRDPAGVLEAVQRAVGVAPRPLRSQVVKNTDEDLRTVIPDFDDLRARFADTPFATVFDVDPVRET